MISNSQSRIKPLLIIIVLAAAVWYVQGEDIVYSLRSFGILPPEPWPENVITDQVTVLSHRSITATFHSYIPYPEPGESMPVLICVGGYISTGKNFMGRGWRKNADKERMVILAPTFPKNDNDFNNNRSYHYPKVWSGRALDRMLEKLSAYEGVDTSRVYMYGFSAGAQVSHRYALIRPHLVKGVAIHAPGSYTFPSRNIPTQFRVSVGQQDSRRLTLARTFISRAHGQNIAARLVVYPNMAHEQSTEQIDESLEFLFDLSKI